MKEGKMDSHFHTCTKLNRADILIFKPKSLNDKSSAGKD